MTGDLLRFTSRLFHFTRLTVDDNTENVYYLLMLILQKLSDYNKGCYQVVYHFNFLLNPKKKYPRIVKNMKLNKTQPSGKVQTRNLNIQLTETAL